MSTRTISGILAAITLLLAGSFAQTTDLAAQDIEVTGRLIQAGELLGIPLLDHVVVGSRRSLSMRAEGLMGAAVVNA